MHIYTQAHAPARVHTHTNIQSLVQGKRLLNHTYIEHSWTYIEHSWTHAHIHHIHIRAHCHSRTQIDEQERGGRARKGEREREGDRGRNFGLSIYVDTAIQLTSIYTPHTDSEREGGRGGDLGLPRHTHPNRVSPKDTTDFHESPVPFDRQKSKNESS